MRRLLLVVLVPLVAADAHAQIGRRSPYGLSEPSAYASLGVAYVNGFSVHDGSTASYWDFGSTTQYVASLEKNMSGGITLGIRGTTASVPLHYTGPAVSTDADANVSQLFGTLHLASGRELHTVLELSAGATLYSNFRARDTGTKLAPSADTDFTFGFGYGVGYAFSPGFSIDVVQDVNTVIHQKTGLSASDNNSVRVGGTRLVVRLGLGGL